MVPITIDAINGITVPVYAGMPILIKMANSMTDTRIIGNEIDLNTNAMIMKIAPMEIILTFLKSTAVISIRSFVQGASPISIAESSYFLMILLISSHCAFTSSVADAYSEATSINWYLPLFNSSLTSSGIISCGTLGPVMESKDTASLTPSTFLISSIMFMLSFADRLLSARIIWVAPMLNCSVSLSLPTLLLKVSGNVLVKS